MLGFLRALVAGIGMGMIVGGVCGLVSGLVGNADVTVKGMGPFNGVWSPYDLRFLESMVAAVGAALFTCALLCRRA
jgi:hypothetical protein